MAHKRRSQAGQGVRVPPSFESQPVGSNPAPRDPAFQALQGARPRTKQTLDFWGYIVDIAWNSRWCERARWRGLSDVPPEFIIMNNKGPKMAWFLIISGVPGP